MNSNKHDQVQWDQPSSQWSPHFRMELSADHVNTCRNEISPSPTFQPLKYAIRVASDKSLQWDPPAESEELALALSYHFPIPQTLEAKMRAAIEKWLRAKTARHNHSINTALVQENVKAKKLAEKNIFGQIQVMPGQEARKRGLRRIKGDVSSIRTGNPRDASADRNAGAQLSSICKTGDGSTEGTDQNTPIVDTRPEMPLIISWQVDTGDATQRQAKKRPYSEDERLRVARNRGNACAGHRRRRQRCDPKNCPQNKQWHKNNAPNQSATLRHDPHQSDNPLFFLPSQSSDGPEKGWSSRVQATDTPSWGPCVDTVSPPTPRRAAEEYAVDAPSQSIQDTPYTTAVRHSRFPNAAAASQSSISSSPRPPSIFTSTYTSGSDGVGRESFSDVSITSGQIREVYDAFNGTECNELDPRQAQKDSPLSSPAHKMMHHVNDALESMRYSGGGDNFHLNHADAVTNPDNAADIPVDMDFESWIHSDGFSDLEQHNSNTFSLGISDDTGIPLTSINPRRLNKVSLTETTTSSHGYTAASALPLPREDFEKTSGFEEDQFTVLSTANLSSLADIATATATMTTSSTISSTRRTAPISTNAGGNNQVVRDYHSPVKAYQSKRRLSSTRSRMSSIRAGGGDPTGDGTTNTSSGGNSMSYSSNSNNCNYSYSNSILRRASTNSTTSQDSRFSTLLLRRGPSSSSSSMAATPTRDSHASGASGSGSDSIVRRDSTNSCTSQESRTDGEWHGGAAAVVVAAAAAERGRERESDDGGPLASARIRRPRDFSCGYKGRLLGARGVAFGKDGGGGGGGADAREMNVENLSLVMHLVHI